MGQAHTTQARRPYSTETRRASIKNIDKRDFVILCPRAARGEGAAEATQALLYLPHNYKLIIASDDMHYDEIIKTVANKSAKTSKFIQTSLATEKTGLPAEAAPFSFADVVVYGGPGPLLTGSAKQSLVVFNISAGRRSTRNGGHDFRVCDSTPEALASAILSVTQS